MNEAQARQIVEASKVTIQTERGWGADLRRIDEEALIAALTAVECGDCAASRKSGCWCDDYGHPCKACEDKQAAIQTQCKLLATIDDRQRRVDAAHLRCADLTARNAELFRLLDEQTNNALAMGARALAAEAQLAQEKQT